MGHRRTWSRFAAAALVFYSTLLGIFSGDPAGAQCAGIPSCGLVWSDEFDGNRVDPAKWSFQLGNGTDYGLPGGWGNNELQYYRAENASVSGGLLTITARRESFMNYSYTSARLRSLGKGDFTYGRFEMRAKLPSGQGLWPAFWMLPSDSIYGGWAASGEIDVMENVGDEPSRVTGALHYGAPWPGNVFSVHEYVLPSGTFDDAFHVFAVEWEEGEIRWYVDGHLFGTQNDWSSTGGPYPAPFDADFHLLLNLAVGGNLPGPPDASTEFPQRLVVDYVRVYQAGVAQPLAVTITKPADGAVVPVAEDLEIEATASGGVIDEVELFQGSGRLGEDRQAPFSITVPRVAAGCYTLAAKVTARSGATALSDPVEVRAGAGCPRAPYLMTPAPLPGTIEAEDFDLGGEGTAYGDADPENRGASYRLDEGVDIASSGGGAQRHVTSIEAGEWLAYTVDVAEAGEYELTARIAAATGDGVLSVTIGDGAASGPLPVPATGGPGQWSDLLVEGLELEAGVQTLRLDVLAGGFELDRITVNRALPPPDPESELALQGERFRVAVTWRTEEGTTSAGRPVRITPDTGIFWFFDPANAEILVKVVDACALAGFENFWVFSAALTSVEYDLTVLDTRTGQAYVVHNPQGLAAPPVLSTDTLFRDCGQQAPGELPRRQTIDTASLPPAPTPQIDSTQEPELAVACLEDETTICLGDGRFRVTATWRTAGGGFGPAALQRLADDSGYGTFFDPSNVELFFKVLDACELAPFHRFWPFVTGLTSVEVDLSIVDSQTGKRYRVRSPEGSVFPTVFDTGSFFVDCQPGGA